MVRRLLSILFSFGLLALLTLKCVPLVVASNTPVHEPDYSKLIGYIELQDLQTPLVVFGSAEKDFDRRLNQENIAYLNKNEELIRSIQSRLHSETLKWQLNTSFKQRLVVTETRDEYARLFEHYCKSSINYLLERIHMPNPYEKILTLKGPLPSIPDHKPNGITAYLVHNLADEYIEEYLFFKKGDDQKKIKIKLSNREFDGKVGAYTSRLKIEENNTFDFVREPYTLWQNSAINPLNVLIVPIEETLHILVRPSTEAAMKLDLARTNPARLQDVHDIIDNWMAVEEAIVGGVVWQVMPDILSRFVPGESVVQLGHSFIERREHPQYRLLEQAIQIVKNLGVEKALSIYKNNPQDFRYMVERDTPAAAIKSAQMSHPHAHLN